MIRLRWHRQPPDGEATRSRAKAEADLARTRAETPLYRALGESLREIRERNHLGEAIAHTFRGEKS